MSVLRHQSFEARARRRNAEVVRRNRKKLDANPLFAHAGIVEQLVRLEAPNWTALSVAYDELARGIAIYETYRDWERRDAQKYAVYRQMLVELIGEENVEEVEADYDQRWPKGHSMQQPIQRISYLNTYMARYTGRTPLDIFEEAKRRLELL